MPAGFFPLLEALALARPFSPGSVEAAIGVKLFLEDQANPYIDRYRAGCWPGTLEEPLGETGTAFGVQVVAVDLRLFKERPEASPLLYVYLGAGTATEAELRLHHPEGVPVPPPIGPPGEAGDPSERPWTWEVQQSDGTLVFGVLDGQVVSIGWDGD